MNFVLQKVPKARASVRFGTRISLPGGKTRGLATDAKASGGWWHSAEFWGRMGAIAGWGMTGAAIYDASTAGPEIISLNMTGVMIVYSSLFARWAWVVKPRNLLLASCHVRYGNLLTHVHVQWSLALTICHSNVIAQLNQGRRALEHKFANGEEEEAKAIGTKAAMGAVGLGALVVGGPTMQAAIVGAELGAISSVAGKNIRTCINYSDE